VTITLLLTARGVDPDDTSEIARILSATAEDLRAREKEHPHGGAVCGLNAARIGRWTLDAE
jgi:hypothetical protein